MLQVLTWAAHSLSKQKRRNRLCGKADDGRDYRREMATRGGVHFRAKELLRRRRKEAATGYVVDHQRHGAQPRKNAPDFRECYKGEMPKLSGKLIQESVEEPSAILRQLEVSVAQDSRQTCKKKSGASGQEMMPLIKPDARWWLRVCIGDYRLCALM